MDIIRQTLNVIFAITQILGGYVLTALNIGTSIGSQSSSSAIPIIPATYAFSIWGFIFSLFLIYAVWQAFPRQRENPLLRKIGFLTAGAFFANTTWELVAQLITFNWPTAVIIVGILVPTLVALFRLARYQKQHGLAPSEKWLVYLPVSVLAGWVSVATFANIASVMAQQGFDWSGSTGTGTAAVFLLAAAILVLWVLQKTQDNLAYALAIVWAFVAITLANIIDTPNVTIAGITIVLTLAIMGKVFYKKSLAR